MAAREADESDRRDKTRPGARWDRAGPHLSSLSQMTRPWQWQRVQRKAAVCKQWPRLCVSLCHDGGTICGGRLLGFSTHRENPLLCNY